MNWEQSQMFVTEELKRLSWVIEQQGQMLIVMQKAVSQLEVRAGIWGLLGGAIPVLIGMGLYLLHH